VAGTLATVPVALAGGPPSSAVGPAQAQGAAVRDSFPHERHQGLFPLCAGCHLGIADGERARSFPPPASCEGCHDGVEQREVDWAPPAPVTGLLDFEHPRHAAEVERDGEAALECTACHSAEGGPRMALVPIEAGRCLTCHGEDPGSHTTSAQDCSACHRPVAETETGEGLLRRLEEPGDHDTEDFLLAHGAELGAGVERCATCHVQERCASCHVDPSLEPIQALPPAPPAWRLPAMIATYPVPASHADEGFERTHGMPAPAPADCSTCHTREDCAACHLTPLPASASALPARPPARPQEVRGPGVGLEARLPDSHESPFFMNAHATVAAAAPQSCASCHTQSYCAECHDAPRAPGYHPAGFALRHAASVSSASMECSNCHNTQAFCRQCHEEVGFGSFGRLGQGYHDAEPVWLLRHGQGARQGLEQCASCHTQRDCLQCHSQLGAFKVNPHGPDFDAEQARSRNPWICSACHLGGAGGT
jgi:hypothetical protein